VAPRNYGRNRIVQAGDDPVTASCQSFASVHGEPYVAETPILFIAFVGRLSANSFANHVCGQLLAERGRREREIKKAVAALARLDDRTLWDIGIPERSQIEQVVRYCRDC
jgi:uncharacterized protein YjiS (DUF1127 family)